MENKEITYISKDRLDYLLYLEKHVSTLIDDAVAERIKKDAVRKPKTRNPPPKDVVK